MNQHVLPSSRTVSGIEPPLRALRRIAALAGCHHAMVHRLGPSTAPMRNLAVLHNWRDPAISALPLCALIDDKALGDLSTGKPLVFFDVPQPLARPLAFAAVHAGLSIPFHNGCGVHAALTLCDTAISVAPARLDALRLAAQPFLANVFAIGLKTQHGLAQREIVCLQWSAAGKTSLETAVILGLSPHTVNQHLAAAGEKLGAVNRTQAVAKAIRLGLIDISLA